MRARRLIDAAKETRREALDVADQAAVDQLQTGIRLYLDAIGLPITEETTAAMIAAAGIAMVWRDEAGDDDATAVMLAMAGLVE